ncbi:hypothetical protein [Halolamina rubra]|uniref:hypothetical protein n=1 Tax=Halolamina rubra TaxID=1380430 RepID=UPI0012AB4130|nr:hypothetical protein [Halolamina rubra]
MIPQRVRCSPLHREERIADVVDTILRADGELLYRVDIDGHHYRVLAAETTPARPLHD